MVQFPPNCFWTKDLDLYKKIMFTNLHPSWGWGGGQFANFFAVARHCMKYPDPQRKVMFTGPYPLQWEVNFEKKIPLIGIEVKCPDLYRKDMLGILPIGKGWGHFTNLFVPNIAFLLCIGAQSSLVMWGTRKHKFHAVLYISCNFHQKLLFVIWPNTLPLG